ncbi:hypothetical protein HK405_013017, partial [Cladochytrium tenue]
IISRLTSLKEYYAHFEELRRTNTELKAEHAQLLADTNGRASEALRANEELQTAIAQEERLLRQDRQRLKLEHRQLEARCATEEERLEQQANVVRRTLADIEAEVANLRAFQELLKEGPAAAERELAKEREKQAEMESRMEEELVNIQRRWDAEQAEVENGWMERVKAIIDGMNNQVLESIDLSPTGPYQQNRRLRRELEVHEQHRKAMADEIHKLQQVHAKSRREAAAARHDSRRDVLGGGPKACPPDVWFEYVKGRMVERQASEGG